jgi:hypothetical protein
MYQITSDLVAILKDPAPKSPFLSLQLGNDEQNAVASIAEIFNRSLELPSTST